MNKTKWNSSSTLCLVLGVGISLFLSGCVTQKDIETACLQTLSASTPICNCAAKNKPTAKETVEVVVPTLPIIDPAGQLSVPETPQPAPLPQAETPPQPDKIIFKEDFETGTYSSFNGEDGEYFGKGIFFQNKIVDKPAEGNYSAALTIGSGEGTAAYLFTYIVPSTPIGYYSADYYVPGKIRTGDWWNVWQWKSKDENFSKPIIRLNFLDENGIFHVYMFYTAGGTNANPDQMIEQVNPIPFPTDQWVNITGIYKSASDDSGYVEIYQDGVKIFEMNGFQTKPGDKNVLWSVNSYADEIKPNPATIYVDNMVIGEIR
jgi:hypothetical protein